MIQPFLCPVMRKAPGRGEGITAAERVSARRFAAREACRGSADQLGVQVDKFDQDELGMPLPTEGWHWSVSHTREIVCGVVYPAPIGIDVERVQERRQDVVRLTADRLEYDVLGGFSWHNFTRAWSAKEAVLKKAGCGLQELSKCRVVASPTPRAIVLHHRATHHFVYQSYHEGHYASICADVADDAEISWDWWEPIKSMGLNATWKE